MIEISNLNPAGSDLFADSESFLTEVQAADTKQIFGGTSSYGYGGKKGSKKGGKKGSKKGSKKRGHGYGYGYGC